MTDRLKLVTLTDDARFAPKRCIQRLGEDIATGAVDPDRIVIVIVKKDGEIEVRGSGPGMETVAEAVGILQLAIIDLAINTGQ